IGKRGFEMGEFGKRGRASWDEENDGKRFKRRIDWDDRRDRNDRRDGELVVYRILCPDEVIGSVIGKSGKVINSIRQDTRAKVKVVDPFPGARDRVITVYCYVHEKEDIEVEGEFNDNKPVCPAQDALLKLHAAITNAVSLLRDSEKRKRDRDGEECHLLVPSSQSASIIGKAGSTIKKLRHKTRTHIRITPKDDRDPAHSCALDFDNFVLISGESEAVKRALFAISAITYQYSAKESIPLDSSIPDAPPSIIIPSDVPLYPAPELYSSLPPVNPERSVSSILGHSHGPDNSGYGNSGTTWPVYTSALPVLSGHAGAPQCKDLTVKMLCPAGKIGRVIGKGGNTIRYIRQDSGAHIEIGDHKAHGDECIITVISKESSDDFKSVAVEAVLLLQGKINDEDHDAVMICLLIPSKVIGCIIGRSGSIINEIRKRTKADIRISKSQKPKCADEDDELVEIKGQLRYVRDALIQIVLRLREDVLKDRDDAQKSSARVEALYSSGPSAPVSSILHNIPTHGSLNYEHRRDTGSGLGLLPSSPYGYRSLSVGDDAYAPLPSNSSSVYRLPPPSPLEMIIPAYAVGKVMGKSGTNIENIRKISGAIIEILDSRSSRGERVALISGTIEQKRAAENLIQAFIM
ncbi:hypothetical protein M569_10179, partial [Genlisea aurea]